MKTQSIFPALAIAALWLGAMSERGDAAVGYTPLIMTNGYNFVANPFNAKTFTLNDNSLTNVIRKAPHGTMVYNWDVANQVFGAPATYSINQPGWDRNFDLSPGKGFVIWANRVWTNTFAGEVPSGTLTVPIAGNNQFSLVASMVPVQATLADLLFPGVDGDFVYLFAAGTQDFLDAFSFFTGFGWFDCKGLAGTNGPTINIGQSFFIQNPGASVNWVRTNTAAAPAGSALAAKSASSGADIANIMVGPSSVTLSILNPSGQPYSVQFSADGLAWATVARNQTGPTWTGPFPGGPRGYYRVTSP